MYYMNYRSSLHLHQRAACNLAFFRSWKFAPFTSAGELRITTVLIRKLYRSTKQNIFKSKGWITKTVIKFLSTILIA